MYFPAVLLPSLQNSPALLPALEAGLLLTATTFTLMSEYNRTPVELAVEREAVVSGCSVQLTCVHTQTHTWTF